MRAVRVAETGGPEVMHVDELPTPEPGEGEIAVKVAAAGVNFIDVYQRTGMYKLPLPLTLGREGAGIVEKIGAGVTNVKPGDHVAWCDVNGSYATHTKIPAARAVPVPSHVDLKTAAAVLLQGLTAHYLAFSTFPLEPGHSCVVHAGAGGVGLLLIQLAKKRGAQVLATVSTDEKAALAKGAGADEIVLYTKDDFVAAAKKMTGGKGVNVVYDSVGKTTFDDSMKALRPRGYLVLYGASSGAVPPVDPQRLNAGGSLFLTRPTLVNYIAEREELLSRSGELFAWIDRGELDVRIGHTYPLAEAGEAHKALEGRKTTGKVLLVP